MLPNDPEPTGLVDAPIPTPVQHPPVERRRGWPFAFAMVLVAVLGGGALFMSGYSVGRDEGRAPGSSVSEADAWKPFWDVYDAVTTRYPLGPIERSTLIEGAIRGLVDAVGDPYSTYLSPEDFQGTHQRHLRDVRGHRRGDRLGGRPGQHQRLRHLRAGLPPRGRRSRSRIRRPRRAGCKPGDVILKVDGVALDGLNPDQARDKVRGKAGTEVTLHIQRFDGSHARSPTGCHARRRGSCSRRSTSRSCGPRSSVAR